MTVNRPYKRTIRPFRDGDYARGGRWMYIRHPAFCKDPEHFIRAYKIIQKDMVELFDYVEPDDINLSTYSYRIHELIVRVCIEVEANFKAILSENKYPNTGRWTIADYRKIEQSHFLSQYEVRLPVWRNGAKVFRPFAEWTGIGKPGWYDEYHAIKHDRHMEFTKANLDNLLQAVSGLVAVLSAQFLTGCFGDTYSLCGDFGPGDGYEDAVGGYFKVRFPSNVPITDRYDFHWSELETKDEPFDHFQYS